MTSDVRRMTRWIISLGVAMLFFCAFGLLHPLVARASTRTVTNCQDAGSPAGSLRLLLSQSSNGDLINFQPGITCPSSGPINLGNPLTISVGVTIDATGNTIVLDGQSVMTVFTVTGGTALQPVTLKGLTIQHGGATNGAGINNTGFLAVTSSTLSGNSATSGGGGIANSGTLTLTNSTLSGNSATTGGGINNSGVLTLTNVTLSGNSAGSGGGGGIFGGSVKASNTLIAGNTISGGNGPDANAIFLAGSINNLIGIGDVSTVGLTNGVNGNQVGTVGTPINALVAPLGSYGGTTQTMGLLPTSPALDAGDDATCVGSPVSGVDQRGISRTVHGAHCDIGAFESRGFTIAVSSGSNQTTTINTAFAQSLVAIVAPIVAGEPVQNAQVTFTAPLSGASATFTGNPATTNVGGTASVTATANGAGGTYNVLASVAGVGGSTFTLNNAAALTSLSPGAGGTGGGSSVSITGQGFGTLADTQVLVDGVAVPAANVTSVTPTTITFITPAHALGTAAITVRVGNVATITSLPYQYLLPASLPGTSPSAAAVGNPNALPGRLAAGATAGNPAPLPSRRP